MEELSVAIITKNEERVIGRLLKSLKGISDIVVVDTGSQDHTVEIAKAAGCRVFEEGDRFKVKATEEDVKKYKELFGIDPTFEAGKGYFHFANARNFAMNQCKNDFVLNMDADEVIDWDLNKVKEAIVNEDQLTYRFCFQHRPDGTPGLEFSHCKMWRKSKIEWVGFIHEIHAPIKGQTPKPPKYCDFIYNHHWQEPKAERGNYMPGLELSLLENPLNDRNLYYTAREYFYLGKFETAIKMFENALKVMWWKPERGQAYIFKSQCHERLKQDDEALKCLHLSLYECNTRREPFFALGEYYANRNLNDQAVSYWLAALGVPYRAHGYLNHMEHYGWQIHDRLATIYAKMGAKELAKEQWLKCLDYDCDKRILLNLNWFYKAPLFSIIVPTCRPEGFARLEKSIKEFTTLNYEIIKLDGEGTAVVKFNQGVEQAKGDYIVFMADDTEATLGWLEKAYATLVEKLNGRGAVAFNDGYWQDRNMGHFLCSKDMAEELGGHLWDPEFKHCGVDPLMYAKLKAKKLAVYAPNAKIVHHHHYCTTKGATKDPKDKWAELVESYTKHDYRLLPIKLMEAGLKDDAAHWSRVYSGLPTGPLDITQKLADMGLTPEGLKVLNLGLGDGTSGLARQLPRMNFDMLTNLEINQDYIEMAKKVSYKSPTEFIQGDLRKEDFIGVDAIFAFDIIEHFTKKDALKVLKKMEKTGSKILIFIPIEKEFRENKHGTSEQEHLSLWTEQEFKEMGYTTTLLPNFHGTFSAMWAVK